MIGMRTAILGALFLMASGAVNVASGQSFTAPGGGKQLFDAMCEGCHGVNGTGDEAPSLNRPDLSMAPDDATLRKILRDGAPARGMPRVRRMTEEEIEVLATYVRTLGRGAATPIVGSAEKGAALYQRLACGACHVVGGQGGILGPELTRVGARRAPNYLRQTLLDPASVLPKGSLGVLMNGFTEYLPVSVVEREGREVRGIRVNEDSFTIQVRDAEGRFYSFRKSDVQNIEKQIGRSMMPSYKDKLSASEADDLVAYLASLGGKK